MCYCGHLHELPTRTRVILLQHPREQRMKVGTARMAHLSLPNSVLRVGLDFSADPVVGAELSGSQPVYLLFPKAGAVDIRELRGGPAITLVVVDGTWRQARRLLRLNPQLDRLPAVAFTPTRPSEYQIRRQPAAHCVSTIEALAEALRLIEPEDPGFERLLEPFRAMVSQQRWYSTHVGQGRWRVRRQPVIHRPPPFACLVPQYPRIVCVQGEGNVWALRDPHRREPSIVHWVACRPATGERYEAIVAPTGPLAPLTPRHVGLSEAQLRAGMTPEQWQRSWQAFLRPDDVLVHWGRFHCAMAQRDGLVLPADSVDLRWLSAHELNRRSGAMEDLLQRLAPGAPAVGLGIPGRAGDRLATLVALVKALVTGPAQDEAGPGAGARHE